jgi:hypothetical protein
MFPCSVFYQCVLAESKHCQKNLCRTWSTLVARTLNLYQTRSKTYQNLQRKRKKWNRAGNENANCRSALLPQKRIFYKGSWLLSPNWRWELKWWKLFIASTGNCLNENKNCRAASLLSRWLQITRLTVFLHSLPPKVSEMHFSVQPCS